LLLLLIFEIIYMYVVLSKKCIITLFKLRFYKLRNSYIIHQRNFGLTFTEGIFISIDLFIIFVSINNLKDKKIKK